MKFENYMGGSLQMLRDGVWHSYDKDNVWLSFDALKVTHRVNEVLCGHRYSITLYIPGKLDRLTPGDWDTLSRLGFPVYLYEVASIHMRRLDGEQQVPDLVTQPLPPRASQTDASGPNKITHANPATASDTQSAGADPWKNTPFPSIADATKQQVLDPKTLLECCKRAGTFIQKHDL